jgi:hypothetical protein
VAEACTGAGASCPADGKAAAGTECRGSAGACDVAETCDGASNACPDNGFASAGTECRATTGDCDVAEACSGSSASCPIDTFVAAGTECRGSTGVCDVAESCTGSAGACPADGFVLAGTECRASGGVCDVAEACDGSSGACPADGFQSSTTVCRASAGLCDAEESCTGSTVDCPADAYQPAGTVCRPEAEACDIAEVCDGTTVSCPSDGFQNEPPVVDAGPDVEVPVTTGTATLAGSATDDGCPSTGSLTVLWSVVGGPGTVTFADDTSASTTATFSDAGVYELELSAFDEIQTSTDRMFVSVNAAPVADAGPDRSITAPALSVVLFGSITDDGLPSTGTLTAAWSTVSGPGTVTFVPDDAQVTTATFSAIGDYVLRLTADDSAMTDTDDVTVRVQPAPDLVVDSVVPPALDGNTLTVSGTASAAVTNNGGAFEDTFSVTFFEDRNGNGTLETAVDGVLGIGSHMGMLDGETVSVDAAVSGTVQFASNITYAFADSGSEITESDENNNYGNSQPPCEAQGPSAPFSPSLEWAWESASGSSSFNVHMTPMIADMNADGTPDVVVTTYPSAQSTLAIVRVIDGRTGLSIMTTSLGSGGINALSGIAQIAVGDIDNDGMPEVVAVNSNGTQLIAFEHDGTFKWRRNSFNLVWGGPALADIDGDGLVEIIAGRTVLNGSDGTIRWTGTGGSGSYIQGPLTPVADLDLDGVPEIIAGRTAYRNDGTIMWDLGALPDGLDSIGQLDADANPEIVLAASNQIWVLEHTGAIKWTAPTAILTGPNGGGVVIADFDGDGANEIGRAGATKYGVWETDGTLKWTATIKDGTVGAGLINITSSSAFDFDNDGAAEVLFSDETGVRVFDGVTGTQKFLQVLGSCTGMENPVVADIDADGRAELVAVANLGNSCGLPGNTLHGVFVFGNDAWVASRKIYNQHTYHITNVNEDATIPEIEESGTTFRKNAPAGCPYLFPDLTASFLRVTAVGAAYDLTVRIGNGGANPVPDGVPITFYDGDPSLGGVELGTTNTTVFLSPGEFQDVTLTVPATPTTGTIWIVADDAGGMLGTLFESDETNNRFDSGIGL